MKSKLDPFTRLVAEDDQPHNIPDSWLWVEIGALSEVIGGGTPSTAKGNYFDGGIIPWITPADMSGYSEMYISAGKRNITEAGLQNSSARLLPKDSLLFSSRAPIGYVAIAKNQITTNQGFKSFPPTEAYIPHYGYWYLRSIKALAESMASGTTFLELSGSKAAVLPFPLPPLAEQRRIVATLDAAMQRVEASQARLEKLPELLKKFRQAVLTAAVSGRLTEAWRADQPVQETGAELLVRIQAERRAQWEEKQRAKLSGKQLSLNDSWKQKYDEPAEPDTSELPELPEGWVWVSPEQIAATSKYSLAIGPFGSNLKVSDYQEEGIPLIFVRDIKSGRFGEVNAKFITPDKAEELMAHQVAAGDILITKMGEPPGDACLYPAGSPTAVITADCVKWTISEKIATTKEFFVFSINSSLIKEQLGLITRGIAQQKISLGRFKTIGFPFPPFTEQQEIVRQVNHYFALANALESRFEQTAAMVEQMPQSLMAKAFSGKLVPQDLSDEPASMLLERLRNAPALDKPKRGRKAPASTLQLELTVPQSLHEILTQHPDGISPEKLFSLAGFAEAEVDIFYQELAELQPQLEETKPTGEAAKQWPNTSSTLRLKNPADAN